jgi:predicted nucleic acid-binding protein
VRLVADANALLSAILGGKANAVIRHPELEEVLTSQATLDEVEEYVPILARNRRLSLDVLLLALAALPVTVVDRAVYASAIQEARKLIGRRDPDDVEILALTLHAKPPLWSNDNDFEGTGVEWYTTAEVLLKLGLSKPQ